MTTPETEFNVIHKYVIEPKKYSDCEWATEISIDENGWVALKDFNAVGGIIDNYFISPYKAKMIAESILKLLEVK